MGLSSRYFSSVLYPYRAYIAASFGAILLAFANTLMKQPINEDGLLYLQTAQTFLQHGYTAATQVYNWPFYSILIGLLSKFCHLNILQAAWLLDTLLQCLLFISFVAIINVLANGRHLQWWAVFTIIAFHTLASNREAIIRDFGYWSFSLLGLLSLLLYLRQQRWRYVIGWSFSMLLATLFRIEGMLFFILVPFMMLFLKGTSHYHRIKQFFQLQSFFLIIALVGLIGLMLKPQLFISHAGRLLDVWNQLQDGYALIINDFQHKVYALQHLILNNFAADNASTLLVGGFILIFIMNLLQTFGLFYSFLFGYSVARKVFVIDIRYYQAIQFIIGLNIVILCLFLAQQWFLANRYIIYLCLLLLLWLPFGLADLSQRARKQPRLLGLLSITILLAILADFIHFGYSKAYLTESGQWLSQRITSQTTVYSNNRQILFYARKTDTQWLTHYQDITPEQLLSTGQWQHYQFLAFRVDHNNQALKQLINATLKTKPIYLQDNKQGDEVWIFSREQTQ